MVHYNDSMTGLGNQHVIIFRDDGWPYPNDANNTLGLTTLTVDADTGEIYDADMEINSTVALSVAGPVPPGGIDFLSIITHEAGHFFGLAHSGDMQATMFAQYTPGSTYGRNLASDDADGICTIYPPGGTRAVDPTVADGGLVPEDKCDPAPRHGLQSPCAVGPAAARGCSVVGPQCPTPRPHPASVAPAAFLLALSARRRARPGAVSGRRHGRRR
jgi:hypothetical protein